MSASEFDAENPLDRVNHEYFAVLEGAKTVFVREEGDGALTYMDKAAFLFEHGARFVEVGTNRKGEAIKDTLGAAWLKWPGRRYYKRGFALLPGECCPDQYNLWKGFGVDPAPGDWSLMRRHVEEIICGGDAKLADYVLRWCAWKVQNPLERPLVALVLKGEEGTGKGFFVEALATIFGKHCSRVNRAEQVVGRFNAAMRGAILVWCDEIYWANNDADVGRLKNQITEPQISIERKGIDPVVENNYAAFVFSTNADWAIPAGKEARRFVVCNVSERQMQRRAYFTALAAERDRGGVAAMLHEFRGMQLGEFHPDRDRPSTAALDEQKAETLRQGRSFARYWLEFLEAGVLPTGSPNPDGTVFVGTGRLLDHLQHIRRLDWISFKAVGAAFKAMSFAGSRDVGGRGWVVPTLCLARERFDRWQFPVAWEDAAGWEVADRGAFETRFKAAAPEEGRPF